MIFCDSAKTRMLYFATNNTYFVIAEVLRYIVSEAKRNQQEAMKTWCIKINSTPPQSIPGGQPGMDIWEATEFDSFEDCLERAKSNWT